MDTIRKSRPAPAAAAAPSAAVALALALAAVLAAQAAYARDQHRLVVGVQIVAPPTTHASWSTHSRHSPHSSHFSHHSPHAFFHHPLPRIHFHAHHPAPLLAPLLVVSPLPRTTVYIEQPPLIAPASPTSGYWYYYCDEARGYYPYVKDCPAGWQRVSPQPGS